MLPRETAKSFSGNEMAGQGGADRSLHAYLIKRRKQRRRASPPLSKRCQMLQGQGSTKNVSLRSGQYALPPEEWLVIRGVTVELSSRWDYDQVAQLTRDIYRVPAGRFARYTFAYVSPTRDFVLWCAVLVRLFARVGASDAIFGATDAGFRAPCSGWRRADRVFSELERHGVAEKGRAENHRSEGGTRKSDGQ